MRGKLAAPILGALLLFASVPNFAQNQPPTAPTTAQPTAEIAEFDQLRLDGFEALFNLDYKLAESKFRRLLAIAPDHPAGYVCLANLSWLRKLYSSRRLQTNLYSQDSFYSETKEAVDPVFDKEFRDTIATAIKKADAMEKTAPRDALPYYYQGAAHGLLAAYEATVTRSFFSALRNGNKSVDLHKKVLELNPEFIDANMTIGLYNYIVGSLPGPVKVLAMVGGFRGSKKRGFELLNRVKENGKYVKDEARVMLVALYQREKRYGDALTEIQYLSNKFPGNYLLRMELGAALARVGKFNESAEVFSALQADPAASSVADVVAYQHGDTLFSQGRIDESIPQFSRLVTLPNANADLVTLSYLRLGNACDLTQRRIEALAHYKKVITRKNVFDSHDQANRYLKKPYIRDQPSAVERERQTGQTPPSP